MCLCVFLSKGERGEGVILGEGLGLVVIASVRLCFCYADVVFVHVCVVSLVSDLLGGKF